MPDDRKSRPVPSGRLERLFGIGAMAGAIGARVALSGARQLLSAQPPRLEDLLLAPANALRVADQLGHMRGAAMKLGQLLSMDAGQILPEEWATILARLQADAPPMPRTQLEQQLVRHWGRGWRDRFADFSMTPMAAASIGQVHRARTRAGQDLAIKVQYPGVAGSIDADIDNMLAVLKLSRLLPAGVDIAPLVEEARRQLKQEADYLHEAEAITRYGALVRDDETLLVPQVIEDLTGRGVLAMTYIESVPIDAVAGRPQAERDRVAARLVRLTLDEVFTFGLVQTDPNFANFRYQPESGRIVLLDFGATREVAPERAGQFARLLRAALARDRSGQRQVMEEIGYFAPGQQRLATLALDLVGMGMDAVLAAPQFDFRAADLPRKARDRALAMGFDADLWSIPPVDTMFLHRKIGGIYLLASRLGARVDLAALFETFATRGPGEALTPARP